MAPSRKAPPKLSPKIVADDAKLASAVDQVILYDPAGAAAHGEIVRLQAELRDLVGADAWTAYLAIDERVTARWAELSVVLVR